MTRLFDIPRTLLLTRWPPDGPYSGAAITRKIASRVRLIATPGSRKVYLDGLNDGTFQTIIDAATRCKEIVRGLLNFSRQSEPQRTLSDLNAVLRDALNLTRNQARISRVEVSEDLDRALPHPVMDPTQIQEVAVNVIVNAIDSMPEGGSLVVRTRSIVTNGAAWAEFEATDTGVGISEENLEHIFDPFFTTKGVGKGTGLGLAISYGIVSEHGGHIDVQSELDQGTTVTVRLPVTSEEDHNESEGTHTCRGRRSDSAP